MTMLVLVNGPPGVGKSTLARRVARARGNALALDIDIVRGMIAGWRDDPHAAGLLARRLAISMIDAHLGGGNDVIVPQFLGRVEFIEELDATARAAGADFIEVALITTRAEALQSFRERAGSLDQTHRDAAALVADAVEAQDTEAEVLGEMFDRFVTAVDSRPATRRVAIERGDIDESERRLSAAIGEAASAD